MHLYAGRGGGVLPASPSVSERDRLDARAHEKAEQLVLVLRVSGASLQL